ncbi:MAG: DUF3990 domain-containing protein [Floccifex sp.]
MIKVDCNYRLKNDIQFLLDTENWDESECCQKLKISRSTIKEILEKDQASEDVCEKIYSYLYKQKYRLNSVKEELAKEKYSNVLFHGSKYGINVIGIEKARENCDFGKGFYLGQSYNQALSFICDMEKSSIYSFCFCLENLKIKQFKCDLEWMIAICFYRGKLKEYGFHPVVNKIITEIENSDVIIAPIVDNKMFYIMAQFMDGDINADVALHSLSASNLGFQYIFRTEKALQQLKPIEKYYISMPECQDCRNKLIERSYEIDTNLKLSKREYKNGLYIEELLR